jgi:hypothetical protein
LPIVRELLAYAAGGQQNQLQQPVGTTIRGTLPAAEYGQGRDPFATGGLDVRGETLVAKESRPLEALQIVRPDGRIEPVSAQSAAAGWDWSFGPANLSGIYSLRRRPNGELQRFAVNVDTTESDLGQADPAELPSDLSRQDTEQHTDDIVHSQISTAGWEQSLLWVVLAMLMAESFMAWHFGRGAV